ncbi:uncharacterized protein LOC120837134 [Ixodes scapularis]|uniref:uncharacterized protein LOC120837134 n=1 Tax=Ixodes scapularis TaxID=6945 RepID=UPI001A9D0609|nr:uncharacterized protein LOC120837134 [Ixodes scapularis]
MAAPAQSAAASGGSSQVASGRNARLCVLVATELNAGLPHDAEPYSPTQVREKLENLSTRYRRGAGSTGDSSGTSQNKSRKRPAGSAMQQLFTVHKEESQSAAKADKRSHKLRKELLYAAAAGVE